MQDLRAATSPTSATPLRRSYVADLRDLLRRPTSPTPTLERKVAMTRLPTRRHPGLRAPRPYQPAPGPAGVSARLPGSADDFDLGTAAGREDLAKARGQHRSGWVAAFLEGLRVFRREPSLEDAGSDGLCAGVLPVHGYRSPRRLRHADVAPELNSLRALPCGCVARGRGRRLLGGGIAAPFRWGTPYRLGGRRGVDQLRRPLVHPLGGVGSVRPRPPGLRRCRSERRLGHRAPTPRAAQPVGPGQQRSPAGGHWVRRHLVRSSAASWRPQSMPRTQCWLPA